MEGAGMGKSALYCSYAAGELHVARARRRCAERKADRFSRGAADAVEPLVFQNVSMEWRRARNWRFIPDAVNAEATNV